MAINTDPLFSFGQNLTPEQVAQMQGLRDTPQQRWETESGTILGARGGSLPGRFGPRIGFTPNQVNRGTGVGADAEFMDDPTGAGVWRITQPRNISTWGGNDVSGVWKEDGTWDGWSSGMTDLRGLGIIAASAVGGAYMNGGFGDPSSATAATGAAGNTMSAAEQSLMNGGGYATDLTTMTGSSPLTSGAGMNTFGTTIGDAGMLSTAAGGVDIAATAAGTGTPPPTGGPPGGSTPNGTPPTGTPPATGNSLLTPQNIKLGTQLAGLALAENQTEPNTVDTQDAVQKQAQANIDAMNATNTANRVNTTTPFGSQTFRQIADPSVPGGIRWEQNISFSPEQQQLYDAQTQGQIGRTQIGNEMLGGIKDTLSQPLNLSSMDPNSLQRGARSNMTASFGGPEVDPLGQMSLMDLGANPSMDRMQSGQGPQARDLYGKTGYSASVDQVRQSVVDQFENQNGQAFSRQLADLDNKLKNMGLTEGTEAYDREMQNLRQSQGQQRNDAVQRGIQAGGAEQSRLAGIDLTADQQRFDQQQTSQFLNPLATIQANNQASNQEYQNLLAAYNQQNQAKDAAQKNAIGVADSANAAENMRLNFGLNQTQLNNQTLSRDQQTALQLAQHNDQNAILERSVPLNNYTALMTGTQATLPQFQPFGMGSAGAAPVMQGAQMQQDQNIANSNRQAGYWQQGLNLFGNWLGS
jgi:hypothetical protein